MTTTQHTQGPWKVKGWNNLSVMALDDAGDEWTIVLMAGGTDTGRGAQLLEMQANARLIAAAPELLVALEYLIEGGYLKEWSLALNTANRAIAKARGEA